MKTETKTYLRAKATSLANGFSHVYILITWIPEIISFISRTLSSVLMAVLKRKDEVFFPSHPVGEIKRENCI